MAPHFCYFQIIGAFVISLSSHGTGLTSGYATIAMPQWRNETNVEVNLDAEAGSLFASLFFIVAAISSPIGGILAGTLGRRKTVILTAPLEATGWLLIGFAQNKLMLYFGRIISSGISCDTLTYSASIRNHCA